MSEPNDRIDGTQRPTKMPWFSCPVNHRQTESTNEMTAASRMRSFERAICSGRDAARGSGPLEGLSGLHASPHGGLDSTHSST